jgi:hypothetical protein
MYKDKQQVIRRNIGKPGYYFTTHNESLETSLCVAPIEKILARIEKIHIRPDSLCKIF